MSITLYTGTPGSGKSFHAAKDIERRMRRGGTLICNFPVNTGFVRKCRAQVEYWDNSELTAERLVAYALEHHKIGKEGQALVVIDECQIIFNCRDFGRKDRNAWVTFFSQHRKLGFNIILITQSDRMLDKQIRSLVEDEVKHRKLKNYGFGGMFLSLFSFGRTWFIAIDYWYGGNKLKLGHSVFPYRKRYSTLYDSYRLFSDMVSAGGAVCAGGNRVSGGAPGNGGAARGDRDERGLLLERLAAVLEEARNRKAAWAPICCLCPYSFANFPKGGMAGGTLPPRPLIQAAQGRGPLRRAGQQVALSMARKSWAFFRA